jgi:proton-translocating NADH-quinone oxidoreductase chain L
MYLALLSLPLSTLICLCLVGRNVGTRGTILLSVFSSLGSVLLSLGIFYEVAISGTVCRLCLGSFFNSGLLDVSWGFLFDTLTAVMCVVVSLISSLVILYSACYMLSDPHLTRFLSYLKLFTVAMLILVTGDNYIQLFVGWELVGLASFLLISFWFTRLQASKSGIQAVLLNRVGDLGLVLGIISLYLAYKTTNFQAVFSATSQSQSEELLLGLTTDRSFSLLDLSCILLFIGAMGKSGQFGLHVWLPNAMNAPTPVSALLHAATMVTAGVFLLARSSPLLEFAPYASSVIIIVGGMTSLFAGTVGLVQNDFKGIIAYSTCSQLGYMVCISGLSSYDLGVFHLFNHAFFKALLFLTAGAVIHSLGEQDVRKLGGLQQKLPFSHASLLVGTLALIGLPFLTGFYSKDLILELGCARYSLVGNFGYILTLFSVVTTSYYSFRLLFLVFYSNPVNGTNIHKRKNPNLFYTFKPEDDYLLLPDEKKKRPESGYESDDDNSGYETDSENEAYEPDNECLPPLKEFRFDGPESYNEYDSSMANIEISKTIIKPGLPNMVVSVKCSDKKENLKKGLGTGHLEITYSEGNFSFFGINNKEHSNLEAISEPVLRLYGFKVRLKENEDLTLAPLQGGLMVLVLMILGFGSIYAGWLFKCMFMGLGTDFWNNSIFLKPSNSDAIEAEFLSQTWKQLPLLGTLVGGVLAYICTVISVKDSYNMSQRMGLQIYLFLSKGWLYDKVLNEVVGSNAYEIGFKFVKLFDKGLLELLPVFGLGLPENLKIVSEKLGKTQSGLIYHYAILMIVTSLCGIWLLSVLPFLELSVNSLPGPTKLMFDGRIVIIMLCSLLLL